MIKRIKNLRRPIETTINGHSVKLLHIGHVILALRRTKWSILEWEKLGLIPPAPFRRRSVDPHLRRRLYPEDYVKRLAVIGSQPYLQDRLPRKYWSLFHDQVYAAYEETVTPLLRDSRVLTEPSDLSGRVDTTPQAFRSSP
jgi:hypothetical protein